MRLLGGAIYLIETRNAGAAFSVGTGATIVLTVVALVVIAVIVRAARGMRSVGWAVALGLILGGALGNLIDRLFRAPGFGRGHVVDWISLFCNDGHIWPVFNLADSAICCGAVTAAIVALPGHRVRRIPPRPAMTQPMSTTRSLPLPDGLAGLRLDVALSRLLGLSRTAAADLVDAGQVLLDGELAGPVGQGARGLVARGHAARSAGDELDRRAPRRSRG